MDIKKEDEIYAEQEYGLDGKWAGVEDDANSYHIEYPFDADKITVTPQIVPMNYLLDRIEAMSVVAPRMQRRAGLWNKERQSQLIESLMLRIPLPLFYVAADKDENWLIVDGLQRITTLKNFIIEGSFSLTGLEFLNKLNDLTYEKLPSKYKNRIRDTQFQFAVVSSSTPSEVQRNIFKRLNTGGLPLTLQEIRHALYYNSETSSLLESMVELQEFAQATDNKIDDSRMAGQELALRFIAFLVRGLNEYPSNDNMDAFLSDTMLLLNEKQCYGEKKYTKSDLLRLFSRSMIAAFGIFNNYAFRKATPLRKSRTPINKSLFDTISVLLAEFRDTQIEKLINEKIKIWGKIDELFYGDKDYSILISRDSNKKSSINLRYKMIKKIFDDSLEN